MVDVNEEGKGFSQLDERASWFYEAIGNTVAMQGSASCGAGQLIETSKDKDGAYLDGGQGVSLADALPNAIQ